jgi:osmotically-inducible protein OsmY
MAWTHEPWTYPESRYYYGWGEVPLPMEPSDGDIKALVVDQLRANPHTKGSDIKVDVKQRVVILGGDVPSWVAKRSAGDDAWDTPGVVDVSNQLVPAGGGANGTWH